MDKSIKHSLLNNSRGFTLVELMVAMVMAAIVIFATMTLSEMAAQSYEAQERVSTAQQGVRAAMDIMVRDIRMAGFDPMAQSNGSLAGAGFTTATATTLQFGADLDASGAIDATDEQIQYDFVGGQLQRDRWPFGTPQVIINNVQNMTFAYQDEDGNATAVLDEIAMVVVNMTIRATDSTGNNYDRALSTRINCRNLRM